jgi:hypothetical protein
LDDKENFIMHPLINLQSDDTHFSSSTTNSLLHAYNIASTPILGVVEPVSAILRLILVRIIGNDPRSMFIVGCFLHSINTFQLAHLLQSLHSLVSFQSRETTTTTTTATTTSGTSCNNRLSSFSIVCSSLLWGIHPLRGEVLGWLSCQSYLFATFFTFSSVNMLLLAQSTLKNSSSSSSSSSSLFDIRNLCCYFGSLSSFALACGCKAVYTKH